MVALSSREADAGLTINHVPGSGVCVWCVCSYEVVSPRRISLTFQEAAVGQVALSPAAEAALAPALLPRGYWNMRLLQAIQEVRAV